MKPMRLDLDVRVLPDGSVQVGREKIKIPNVAIDQELGRGANGIVFLATNQYLQRVVALKLWIKLRHKDARDKFLQGMQEARKAASLTNPFTLAIYDAGATGPHFYATMEYYPSISLERYMAACSPAFTSRKYIVTELLWANELCISSGVVHGDIHIGNVLLPAHFLTMSEIPKRTTPYPYLGLKIVDFGTSHFTRRGFSSRRHWRVLEQTLDTLLSPLKMETLWSHRKPNESADVKQMESWFHSYSSSIGLMLKHAFENASPSILRKTSDPVPIVTREGHEFLRGLINSGSLSERSLGNMYPRGSPIHDFQSLIVEP